MSFMARNSMQEAHDGKLQAAAVFTALQSALTSEREFPEISYFQFLKCLFNATKSIAGSLGAKQQMKKKV